MNDLDLFSNSPSLNLTSHQPPPPIFSSTPLVPIEKPLPSSTTSSFFIPLTENTQNNEQIIKLNEELCLLGLFDFIPTTLNIDQTLSACRQLVKNYNKLSEDKHVLHEKLKKIENQQNKYEKQDDVTKHDLDRLNIKNERLFDQNEKHNTKLNQLTQLIQTKEKEIRRLNQIFAQQTALAKHQYRSLEKQIDKLKERILNYEKNQMMSSTIEYSWPLILNESIPSVSSLSSSEILLKKICHDYDQKHRLLMIENEQLRQCVVNIYEKFQHLLLIHRSPADDLIECDTDDKPFEMQLMELPCDAVNEIVQRYFSKIYDRIDRYMLHEKNPSQIHFVVRDISKQASLHDHFLES